MRALGMDWRVYAAICAAVPLLWGLAVCWILRHLPEQRRHGPPPGPRDEAGTVGEDYRI